MGVRQWWSGQSTAGKAAMVVGILVVAVAVAVVGSAIVGAFVLSVGESTETAPQASFGVESGSESDAVAVVHEGGDSIDAASLVVEVGNRTVSWSPSDGSVDPEDELVVEDVASGTTVTVFWIDDDGRRLVLAQEIV